jgi:hypothetical protein
MRAPAHAPLLAALLLALCAMPAGASRSDWIGSAACGACHPAELRAWRATAHATAATPLGARPAGRCLACHGTGESPAGPTVEAAVGCEACHGAGAAYAPDDVMRDPVLARALGLRDVSTPGARARVCATCHQATTRLRPFDPQAPVHSVSAKAP